MIEDSPPLAQCRSSEDLILRRAEEARKEMGRLKRKNDRFVQKLRDGSRVFTPKKSLQITMIEEFNLSSNNRIEQRKLMNATESSFVSPVLTSSTDAPQIIMRLASENFSSPEIIINPKSPRRNYQAPKPLRTPKQHRSPACKPPRTPKLHRKILSSPAFSSVRRPRVILSPRSPNGISARLVLSPRGVLSPRVVLSPRTSKGVSTKNGALFRRKAIPRLLTLLDQSTKNSSEPSACGLDSYKQSPDRISSASDMNPGHRRKLTKTLHFKEDHIDKHCIAKKLKLSGPKPIAKNIRIGRTPKEFCSFKASTRASNETFSPNSWPNKQSLRLSDKMKGLILGQKQSSKKRKLLYDMDIDEN